MFRCRECKRDCDIMVDGCNELIDTSEMCDKCFYGEWTESEIKEREDQLRYDKEYCECCGGCWWCLDVEARSFR